MPACLRLPHAWPQASYPRPHPLPATRRTGPPPERCTRSSGMRLHASKSLDACKRVSRNACTAHKRAVPLKRQRAGAPAHWNVVGELLAQASVGASPQPAQQLQRSTEWDPVALRSARVANAEELVAQGCRCRSLDCRFVQWVLESCPLGVIRFRPNMTKTVGTLVALLRHGALFQLLSRA